jgi:hypothetical protein
MLPSGMTPNKIHGLQKNEDTVLHEVEKRQSQTVWHFQNFQMHSHFEKFGVFKHFATFEQGLWDQSLLN